MNDLTERFATTVAILFGLAVGGSIVFAACAGLIGLGFWFLRIAGLAA